MSGILICLCHVVFKSLLELWSQDHVLGNLDGFIIQDFELVCHVVLDDSFRLLDRLGLGILADKLIKPLTVQITLVLCWSLQGWGFNSALSSSCGDNQNGYKRFHF